MSDLNAQLVRNTILGLLPARENRTILEQLVPVKLCRDQVLCEAGKPIQHAYFVEEGILSVFAAQEDGKAIEVAFFGDDGFVGVPLLAGYRTSPTRIVVRVGGLALRCDAGKALQMLQACPALTIGVQRFAQTLTMEITQNAVCNIFHGVEQRLARWLVMSRDLQESDSLAFTQDDLSMRLGVRRASITAASVRLNKARLILRERGRILILDRLGLEKAACHCYQSLKQQLKKWEAERN